MTQSQRNAKVKEIQELLTQARSILDSAIAIADEIDFGFDFLEMRYTPKKVIEGSWNRQEEESFWRSSDVSC